MKRVNWSMVQGMIHSLAQTAGMINQRAAEDLHYVAGLVTDIPHHMVTEHLCEVCEEPLDVVHHLCPSGYHYKVGFRQVLRCNNPECSEKIAVR